MGDGLSLFQACLVLPPMVKRQNRPRFVQSGWLNKSKKNLEQVMTRAEVLDKLDRLTRSGSAALNAARQLALQFPDAVLEHLEVASTPQGGIQFRMPIRQHNAQITVLADGTMVDRVGVFEDGDWRPIHEGTSRLVSHAVSWIALWERIAGFAPTRTAQEATRQFIRQLPQTVRAHAVVDSGVPGSVRLEWRIYPYDCELTVWPDGLLALETAMYENGGWRVQFMDKTYSISRAATWVPILESVLKDACKPKPAQPTND